MSETLTVKHSTKPQTIIPKPETLNSNLETLSLLIGIKRGDG
jgi:hypothetical protein